ncbi:unnamed protein product, partial [Urochloa humidicola]
ESSASTPPRRSLSPPLLPPPPTHSSPTPRPASTGHGWAARRWEQLRAAAAAGSARLGCAPQREKLFLRLLFLLWPPRGPFLRRPPPGGHGRARRQIPTAVSSSSRELRRDASSAGELLPAFRRGAAFSPRTGRSRPLPEPSSNGGGGLRAVHSIGGRGGGSTTTARRAGAAVSAPSLSHHHTPRSSPPHLLLPQFRITIREEEAGAAVAVAAAMVALHPVPRICFLVIVEGASSNKCVMVPSKMKHSIHSIVEVSAQVPAAG